MPWKWTQTKNTDLMSVWEHDDYKLVGRGHWYGKKLVRDDWRVYRLDVELIKVDRLQPAKTYAENRQREIENDVVKLIGKISQDEKFVSQPYYGDDRWFAVIRDWAISQQLIGRYRESERYPVELRVTDAGQAWFEQRATVNP